MERAVVFFATSNSRKVDEIRYVLRNYLLEVKHLNVKGLEIQAEAAEEIAKNSALRTAREHRIPVLVEDTELSIAALNGFPGPYAAYAYKTLGTRGILKLLEGMDDRRATFRSAIAFCDLAESVTCFMGECLGSISTEARGDHGFGFDPIFEPYDGDGRTFAEMRLEEKSAVSHRSRAARKFADWYVKRLNI